MPTSPRGATSAGREGAEWFSLRSVESDAGADGCFGIAGVLFGAVFTAAGIAAIVTQSLLAALIVLIGLVMAVAGARLILAAVGPRPRVWAERTEIEVGENFRVRWAVEGAFKEARSIQITWQGVEVSVKQAYNPIFHRSTFVTRVLTSEIGPLAGTASVVVPETAMPSFAAKNARIEWLLLAEVATHRWPDVKETYPITILPSRTEPT